MALQYGYNYRGHDKSGNKKWKAKFEALSDEDREFYHNSLPWILLFTGVSHVSKESIPVIAHRLRVYNPIMIPSVGGKKLDDWEFRLYLQEFIGFEANVGTETDSEWMKRVFKPRFKSPYASEKGIEAEWDRYLAEVYK